MFEAQTMDILRELTAIRRLLEERVDKLQKNTDKPRWYED